MKKIICLLMALVLCMGVALSAFAAETEFVPSISYKDGPDVEMAKLDDEDVTPCVIVTSIKGAENKSTDIKQEERDELLDVYNKLLNGEMELPLDGNYIIRDLVDVSFEYDDCRTIDTHGAKDEALKEEGVTLTVDFDLGVSASDNLKVLVYVDGQWQLVDAVTVNSDGSVTVIFEDICPVAFCVESKADADIPTTGDNQNGMIIWVVLLVVSAVAIVLLEIKRRKAVR